MHSSLLREQQSKEVKTVLSVCLCVFFFVFSFPPFFNISVLLANGIPFLKKRKKNSCFSLVYFKNALSENYSIVDCNVVAPAKASAIPSN